MQWTADQQRVEDARERADGAAQRPGSGGGRRAAARPRFDPKVADAQHDGVEHEAHAITALCGGSGKKALVRDW